MQLLHHPQLWDLGKCSDTPEIYISCSSSPPILDIEKPLHLLSIDQRKRFTENIHESAIHLTVLSWIVDVVVDTSLLSNELPLYDVLVCILSL